MAVGWIGVDLDATLAVYDGWKGELVIGEPIKVMVDRVLSWIEDDGLEVRIFTARVSGEDSTTVRLAIKEWLKRAGLPNLKVTNVKDYQMLELWDDRCVQVEANTGKILGISNRG